MHEAIRDLWTEPCDARCITTNAALKKNGAVVMGRGCAKEARDKYPGLDLLFGEKVKLNGNHVQILLSSESPVLVAYPVKHNWWEKADLELIKRSAGELVLMTNTKKWDKIVVPRPGCGNGQLLWEDVKPVLEQILDDRFWVITK